MDIQWKAARIVLLQTFFTYVELVGIVFWGTLLNLPTELAWFFSGTLNSALWYPLSKLCQSLTYMASRLPDEETGSLEVPALVSSEFKQMTSSATELKD